MASFGAAAAAIRSRVEAGATGLTLAWPNEGEPAAAAAGEPWIYVEILGTDANIRGVGKPGDHVVVEDGLVIATVFLPRGVGVSYGYQMAEQIGEVLRVKQFYDAEPGVCVRTWTPRVSDGGASVNDDPWHSVSVTIPFEFWRRA